MSLFPTSVVIRPLGRTLKPVTILGENIVLYRKQDGRAAALEDACPHRKLPLSMGRIKGDDVECGYHGLTFDCTGTCTRVPGGEKIPHVACVRSYPIHERYGLLWVWMGDADKADPSLIFHVDHWGDPAWGLNRGDSMAINCNYLYMTDNLLDPSHVAWVHQSSFGNAATEEAPLETTIGENGVTVWRWMLDVEPAPFYAPYLKFKGNTDRKQHYEVHYPSHAIIKAIFAPAGSGGEGRPLHEDTFLMDSYNFMTPIDAVYTGRGESWFYAIGSGRVLGIPFQVWIMAGIVIVAAWALQRTVFGRQVLATGGNEAAARLAGVPTARVKLLVYGISGLLSGIAGLIVIAINSSSDANLVGLGMELDAIAAVAVGGTLLSGGRATVIGTLLGALIIQLVRYTLLANGVPDAAALVVKALIIVLAVWLQRRGPA